jgi:hypothetical protein
MTNLSFLECSSIREQRSKITMVSQEHKLQQLERKNERFQKHKVTFFILINKLIEAKLQSQEKMKDARFFPSEALGQGADY